MAGASRKRGFQPLSCDGGIPAPKSSSNRDTGILPKSPAALQLYEATLKSHPIDFLPAGEIIGIQDQIRTAMLTNSPQLSSGEYTFVDLTQSLLWKKNKQ